MGMIMHDDVPYGEGTSYTQGTGIAINNNVIAVDADNTPTENSEKPVKSKGVYEEIEQIYADNGVLGAKNLLSNTATSQTINGVTFIVNADGSVTANGTATADSTCFIQGSGWNYNNTVENFLEQGETYILSDGVNSYTGDKNVPNIRMYGYALAGTAWSYGEITPNTNKEFTVDAIMKSCHISVYIRVPNGQTVSNLVFKPMLRLASDPDDTYVPYAMTNRELTETVDEFTASRAPVNGVVTFSDLNPDYGYKLFVDIPDETSSLPTNLTDLPVCKWTKVQRSTKADGTITLAYTVTNTNVNYCLRILK